MLTDDDLARLQTLLDALPEPLQPLDISALDGYLCGVLLQPRPVPAAQWQRFVVDIEGRPAPPGAALDELLALVQRRHAELDRAIANRQWFDPWIYQLDDAGSDDSGDSGDSVDSGEPGEAGESGDGSPSESVLPWVAGFAAATEQFPALTALDHPELVEPLALLFMHFDEDDLEDADALVAVIQTLEPPADLAEAVQDVVRALMLLADVSRPRKPVRPARPAVPRTRRSR